MVAKLVVDSLGQQRSLVGPVALLTALTVGGALLSAAGTYLLGRAAESVVLTARQGWSPSCCGCGWAPSTASSRATCCPG